MGVLIEDIRHQLDRLEGQGLTREANTFGGPSAYISAEGMAVAKEPRKTGKGDGPASRTTGFD